MLEPSQRTASLPLQSPPPPLRLALPKLAAIASAHQSLCAASHDGGAVSDESFAEALAAAESACSWCAPGEVKLMPAVLSPRRTQKRFRREHCHSEHTSGCDLASHELFGLPCAAVLARGDSRGRRAAQADAVAHAQRPTRLLLDSGQVANGVPRSPIVCSSHVDHMRAPVEGGVLS